ncbi:MAG: toxin-activating lysine-acyltransferase [Betaproteobacteria bacterium]|nr:toxin-activating lysine-acyltransferase [Betaproteobacteria bacterium]MCL2887071.1 toxin-activating lysine-acyltransferase [Betaproteobacteria bacterium]
MNPPPLSIVAPGLVEQPWNEAEIMGGAVWLWMHSAEHRDFPLHTLPVLLLPAIKNRQFIFASEAGKPVFYLSWANLSLEAEQRYLANNPLLMPEADWNSGERMWILDWVAPFGHTPVMSRLVRQSFFANRCWRALDHRGNERGLKIKTYRGAAALSARQWFAAHPAADF